MKTVFRFASLLSAAVMLFASCGETGNGDGTGNNGDGPGPAPDTPSNGTLTLDVDRLIIQSNGEDASTLTVKLDDVVITEDIILFDGANKVVDLGSAMKFTTTEQGEYTFWANYKTFNSNKVKITAVPTEVPETPEDSQPENTSFVRRFLVTKFTGQGCQYCPNATKSLHTFFYGDSEATPAVEPHELAPYVVKAEAHTFSSEDPAYFGGSFYGVESFPTLVFDWAILTSYVDYTTLTTCISERYNSGPAKAGISVNSKCSDGAVTLKACVKAAESREYRIGAWLLEDNIQGQQKGAPTDKDGKPIAWYHEYDGCIRIAESKTGTLYSGISLGVIEAGKTAEKMFTWTLDDSWKVENLRLCIFVSIPSKTGYTFEVTNVISAPVDGEVAFEYR